MSAALAMFRTGKRDGDIRKSAQKVSDHKKDAITRLKHLRHILGKNYENYSVNCKLRPWCYGALLASTIRPTWLCTSNVFVSLNMLLRAVIFRAEGYPNPPASVRRPCTIISIWTFVSWVRELLSPASLKMRARATLQGSRIPLSRCPGKVKSTSGIVQNKSVLTRRESQHMSIFVLEWSLKNFKEIKWSYKAFKLTSFPSI